MKRELDTDNCIKLYMHCRRCLEERPGDVSPRDWAQLECGWTQQGFQVWCRRHEINVVHVDFEGQQHPATMAVSSTVLTPSAGS